MLQQLPPAIFDDQGLRYELKVPNPNHIYDPFKNNTIVLGTGYYCLAVRSAINSSVKTVNIYLTVTNDLVAKRLIQLADAIYLTPGVLAGLYTYIQFPQASLGHPDERANTGQVFRVYRIVDSTTSRVIFEVRDDIDRFSYSFIDAVSGRHNIADDVMQCRPYGLPYQDWRIVKKRIRQINQYESAAARTRAEVEEDILRNVHGLSPAPRRNEERCLIS